MHKVHSLADDTALIVLVTHHDVGCLRLEVLAVHCSHVFCRGQAISGGLLARSQVSQERPLGFIALD